MNTQAIAPVVMQNLVAVVESGALMTTSIKVAEAFGKRHDNVLAKLKTLQCSSDFRLLNFKEASQTVQQPNGGTAEYKIWSMTKDGFMFLVMGFTGTKAAAIKEAYIAEFNRMADELHRRELATLVDDIPFPPVASELHKCDAQQLAKALCHKIGATRYMLNIDPSCGSMGGHRGSDSITLYPVNDASFVLDLSDQRQLCHSTGFMSNEQLANLMSAAMTALNQRTAQLSRQLGK
ncbi:Rha family transcriptional regulator [Aeromonas veronii]|uniref:Rha family transcriptional regulator n=1 Tax=Aeromonas veronii TaxID=654 RepID=UPI0020916513|nr:Rha family transcriptional regulator [Aeromonas veronii]MCO5341080.1 Rha family transcriptional regulator [Aeromonas veronii]